MDSYISMLQLFQQVSLVLISDDWVDQKKRWFSGATQFMELWSFGGLGDAEYPKKEESD